MVRVSPLLLLYLGISSTLDQFPNPSLFYYYNATIFLNYIALNLGLKLPAEDLPSSKRRR